LPLTETITAFAALVVATWAIVMARDPRSWRYWWCAQLGLSDLNTTRQQRRWQEQRLKIAAIAVGVLGLVVALFAGSAVVWSVRQMNFGLRTVKTEGVISVGSGRVGQSMK
jgi:hypothetical protein